MRATPMRMWMLRLFQDRRGPFSASEVHAALGAGNLSSVYRALESFAEAGLVISSRGSDGVARFCLQPSEPLRHNHFECRRCGRLLHFDCTPMGAIVEEIGRKNGFEVNDAELRLTGECAKCRKGVGG